MHPVLGIDFDNTLICYDDVFYQVAVEQGMIPSDTARNKTAVKNHFLAVDQEYLWTELQGEIYGPNISKARLFDGAFETIKYLMNAGVKCRLISHKTRTPYSGRPHDLHAAAMNWLEENKFFLEDGLNWKKEQVFFEVTKESKISRICSEGCTHFLDDLTEILMLLPDSVRRLKFNPHAKSESDKDTACREISNWRHLPQLIL